MNAIKFFKSRDYRNSLTNLHISAYLKVMNKICGGLNCSLILVSMLLLILFSGCDNSEMDSLTQTPITECRTFPGVYPKSINSNRNGTRCGEGGYWESWDCINLYDGRVVSTPWYTSFSSSAVPADALHDIKYDDGWDLIFHYLECKSGKDYHSNIPYLIFHNRYTGILKVFYYLLNSSFYPNNHGIWQIKSDGPSSLFAFQNNPVSLISEKQNEVHFVSTLTNNSTGGFTTGWNCFQIELAYDPMQSGYLHISALSSNTVQLSFSGNLEADTSGLILSSKGTNSYSTYNKGVAKAAGDVAEGWIEKKLKDKTINPKVSSLIKEGVKGLVSGGVGSALGALTGLFKSDETTTSLQLTTNGTFTCEGTATFESTAGIDPLVLCIDPDSVGYLGAWGLQREPTLLFSPYAILKSPQEYTNGYTREYLVSIANANAMPSVKINPSLSQFVKKTEILTTYYQTEQPTRRDIWGGIGTKGRDLKDKDKVYDNLYEANLRIIADVAFKGDENAYIPAYMLDAPMEVFIPNVPNGPQGAVPDFTYNSRYLASVGVHFTLPNGSEAYSYHRCIPYVDWNLSEYNNGLYWYLYPCEPVNY